MEEPKIPKQLAPSEPGPTPLFLTESLTVVLLLSALGVDLDPQAMASQTGDVLFKATQSLSQRPAGNSPKSCPNDLATNPVLEALLIKAGLPANATIISIIGHKVRYYVDDCKEVFTVEIQYTGNRYRISGLRAPTLPTKTKPKN